MSLELVNLADVRPEPLESLMAEEGEMWLGKLKWNYTPTHQFIKNYLAMGLLPGLVLMDGDTPVGYAYMVFDGKRAVIGNIYVDKENWGNGYEALLAEGLIGICQNADAIDRIEAQVLIFSGADIATAFKKAGFNLYGRNYLSLPLREWESSKKRPEGYRLAAWKNSMIYEAARVVFESYRGGIDAEFSTSFSKLDKCEEFVTNLIRRGGCGEFLKKMTTVAIAGDGRMAGIVISTKLSKDCGHHPQISVMPSHHGKGLGAWLVDESLRRFKNAGFSNVSLTVTEKNEKADAWYRRVGYAQTLGFNAYLWLR